MTRALTVLRPGRSRWGLVALLVLIVALIVRWVWLGLEVRSELNAGRADASRIRTAISAGDAAAVRRALGAFSIHLADAARHTGGPSWWLLSHLPFVGDDARAARVVASAGDDLARHALQPLAAHLGGGLAGALAPHDGRLDLARIDALRAPLDRAAAATDRQSRALEAVDPTGLTGAIRTPFEQLRGEIRSLATDLRAAATATRLAPNLLGGQGPRTYLLLFDNNAEIRADGGMPGAWAVLRADHGRLSLTRQGSAGQIPPFAHPVLPQSAAERQLFGPEVATFFQDTGFTPDFPRTADLVRAMWQRRFGVRLDGVASLDTVTLGYLLRATGPISSHGVTLTSANATDELLDGVYRRFGTNAEQDAFYRDVAGQVFRRVSAGRAAPAALLSALTQSVRERRTHLHVFDAAEQAGIAGTPLADELVVAHDAHPRLGVYLNDATGSKMAFYLRRRFEVRPTSCSGSRQRLDASLTMTLRKAAPGSLNDFVTGSGAYGTPKGDLIVVAHVYGPVGGTLQQFRLDGQSLKPDLAVDRGRPVATAVVELRGGHSDRLTWTAQSGPGQTGESYVDRTPGVDAMASFQRLPSHC